MRRSRDAILATGEAALEADRVATSLYGFTENELRDLWGPHPYGYEPRTLSAEERERISGLVRDFLAERWTPDDDALDGYSFSGSKRVLTKKGFFSSRLVEVLSHLTCAHPRSILDALEHDATWRDHMERALAHDVASVLVGVALGRWHVGAPRSTEVDPFGQVPLPVPPPPGWGAILHDDAGGSRDLHAAVDNAIDALGGEPTIVRRELAAKLDASDDRCTRWFSTRFFDEHLRRYSRSRRMAPIYWQFATPSASYSIWLYIHCFNSDTLYKVQNEYVAPKLVHEERRLEAMRRELGESPNAKERKALAVQENFVEELRVFHEDVKRVAPLWNPNLDDGVIVNFAPLWQLVPQHKSWQKELKDTWDALRAGNYDWTHLAMHLWPERVIPKCATDRSLAIAHGLDDIFWVEADGKWKPRARQLRPIDEIVRERTSPAVKAALKNLLAGPLAPAGRGRGGRRISPAAGVEERGH
jgi:hypothetical protein